MTDEIRTTSEKRPPVAIVKEPTPIYEYSTLDELKKMSSQFVIESGMADRSTFYVKMVRIDRAVELRNTDEEALHVDVLQMRRIHAVKVEAK